MEELKINRVTVTILGEEYTIKGFASPESLERAARRVDRVMQALIVKNRQMSRHRIAVLAAINLADELNRLSDEAEEHTGEMKERGEEDELV